jgi:SAM-dependent methyltransferase
LEQIDVQDVLDVYCGARPYEPLFSPGTHYVGLDIDDAYGCADIVSDELLPFPDKSFDLCFCTQAFYYVPDGPHAVAEFARVLRPGGHAIVTVPVVYPGTERLYSRAQLAELFEGWERVTIVDNGRSVVSLMTLAGYLGHELEKRSSSRLRPGFAALYALMNLIGEVGDRAERRLLASSDALPTNLLVHAQTGSS